MVSFINEWKQNKCHDKNGLLKISYTLKNKADTKHVRNVKITQVFYSYAGIWNKAHLMHVEARRSISSIGK